MSNSFSLFLLRTNCFFNLSHFFFILNVGFNNDTTISEEKVGVSYSKNGSTHVNKCRKILEEYIAFGFIQV